MSSKEISKRVEKVGEIQNPITHAEDGIAQGKELPVMLVQRARSDARLLSPKDVLRLQRMSGNRAVAQLINNKPQRQPITTTPFPIQVLQRLMSQEKFIEVTSNIVTSGWIWSRKTETIRIDPKTILEKIDELLDRCHQDRPEHGGSLEYSADLQALLNYLTGDAEKAKVNIGALKMSGEKVPPQALQYNNAINTLTHDVIAEKKEADEALIGQFQTFERASMEERRTRMVFAQSKYARVGHLLNDIPLATAEGALKKLLANFYARTDYTYKFGGGGELFTSSGNCWSVCNEYQMLAKEALGITVDSPGYTLLDVRVKNPQKIIGADMLGDVDGGENGWMWENHAVVTWQGTTIDVLYGLWGSTGISAAHIGKEPDDYWTLGGENIYRTKEQIAKNQWKYKYTLDREKASYIPL